MTKQIACIYSPFSGNGTTTPYAPTFTPLAGEHWAWNLLDLLSTVRQYHDNLPSDDTVQKHGVAAAITPPGATAGGCVVYVYAEHIRINAAIAAVQYHVAWSYTIDRQAPQVATELHPLTNTLQTEALALRDWLATLYGVTTTKVTNWFADKYQTTPQSLLGIVSTNQRQLFVKRIADELISYATTKGELDNA